MGDYTHGRRARTATEVVDAGHRHVEVVAILRHYLAMAERQELVGLLVVAETARGGYSSRESKMTGCDNVAERLGRLLLLMDDVRDAATEDE